MLYRFTIVGDGPTDRALKPIVNWALLEIPHVASTGFLVDFTVGRGENNDLASRIKRAVRELPCDILLVHRDAEKEPPSQRLDEIGVATKGITSQYVPIVPVRMTEAWLLVNEQAIRHAADNPNGSVRLEIPRISQLEALPDPKDVCNTLLVTASESNGRRRHKFSRESELAARRCRIAELINDFSPLRSVPAFATFQQLLQTACAGLKID
jgi:hypothetical protein